MTKRRRVFIISLIVLLLVITLGLYTLFFTGKLGILADLVTGPEEQVVAAKTAQEIWDSALTRTDSLELIDASGASYAKKIVLRDNELEGAIHGKINPKKLQYIRRMLWDSSTPAETTMTMWIRTTSGNDWSDWRMIDGRLEAYTIKSSVREVEYVAHLAREEIIFPLVETKALLAQKNDLVQLPDYGMTDQNLDQLQKEMTRTKVELSEEETTRLYAHLFYDNDDKGRYLGAMADVSGMGLNIYYPVLLTDETVLLGDRDIAGSIRSYNEERNTEWYSQKEMVKNIQEHISVRFVDESSNSAKGTARLAINENGSWTEKGNFISSMVSVGANTNLFNGIWVTGPGGDQEAQTRVTAVEVSRGRMRDDDSIKNSEVYKSVEKVQEWQQNIRMKFVADSDVRLVPIDDGIGAKEMANLELNDREEGRGDMVGVGVEISGPNPIFFHPIWITDSDAHVGPLEYNRFMLQPEGRKTQWQTHSEGFEELDSVAILRGESESPLQNQKVAIYIDVREGTPEDPEVCQDFDRVEINPSTVTMAPNYKYRFAAYTYNEDNQLMDLELLFSAEEGIIDNNGNYTAPSQEGIDQVTVASECGGSDLATVTIEEGAPPPAPPTPPPSIGTPALYQIGLTAGYGAGEGEDEDAPPSQGPEPSGVPGWLKGGLLKTGSDLLVLIIITVLVVIAIVYMVSLLRRGEDLGRKDQTKVEQKQE